MTNYFGHHDEECMIYKQYVVVNKVCAGSCCKQFRPHGTLHFDCWRSSIDSIYRQQFIRINDVGGTPSAKLANNFVWRGGDSLFGCKEGFEPHAQSVNA